MTVGAIQLNRFYGTSANKYIGKCSSEELRAEASGFSLLPKTNPKLPSVRDMALGMRGRSSVEVGLLFNVNPMVVAEWRADHLAEKLG